MSLIIPELPEQHWHTAMAMLTKAYPQPSAHIVAAGAGQVYRRKEEDNVRELHQPPTRSYESDDDDAVITVTVRLSWKDALEIGLPLLTSALREEQLKELYARRDRAQEELSNVNGLIAAVWDGEDDS